jgi:ubiquinone/menaquinone biosynthesis C-methylase UbiE
MTTNTTPIIKPTKTEEFVQTWWNDNVKSDDNIFYNWICNSDALTKVYARKHIIEKQYKSILDVGCANATMYYGFLNDDKYDIDYTGIDSCKYLVKKNINNDINVILGNVNKTIFKDSLFDVVFSRHIVEHQPSCEPLLLETIRIAKKEVIHVFFKKPISSSSSSYSHIINYDPSSNLYHNTYSQFLIEYLLSHHSKVKTFTWNDISIDECVLHIMLHE